jgi:hypothetical protein
VQILVTYNLFTAYSSRTVNSYIVRLKSAAEKVSLLQVP